jgi:predicted  nucleic acid-binding Zn-ribbon protein
MDYLIDYECPECGHQWDEVWDCPCDSECPECGCRDIQAAAYHPLSAEPDDEGG